MPFSRVANNIIREAMAKGEFDNLPNAGSPLDLEEYFRAPAELRMAYSILKSAKCAPAEVDLMNEIARLKQSLTTAADAAQREQMQRTLSDRQMQLAMMLERRQRGEK